MASFQNSVLTIATILLVIVLIFIGISLYKNKKNLGKKECPKKMDFSAAFWSSDKGLCLKKSMANNCDLTWDGVTNNNSMVC